MRVPGRVAAYNARLGELRIGEIPKRVVTRISGNMAATCLTENLSTDLEFTSGARLCGSRSTKFRLKLPTGTSVNVLLSASAVATKHVNGSNGGTPNSLSSNVMHTCVCNAASFRIDPSSVRLSIS